MLVLGIYIFMLSPSYIDKMQVSSYDEIRNHLRELVRGYLDYKVSLIELEY